MREPKVGWNCLPKKPTCQLESILTSKTAMIPRRGWTQQRALGPGI
jgi:hypothetical protein